MSKIIQAANAMLEKKESISDVIKGRDEYFFLYKNKYKWSMSHDRDDDVYYLFYYPGDITLEQLADLEARGNWKGTEVMNYNTRDLGTKEGYNTFKDLYTTLKEKVFGIDKVLDDIIEKEKPF